MIIDILKFMLLSRGVRLHFMYDRIPTNYFFSTSAQNKSKIHLSFQAQRAIWACKVIQWIVCASGSQELSSPSLRDQLINLKIDQNKYELNEQIRNQVLSIFTSGFSLHQSHLSQSAILEKQQQEQQTLLQQQNFVLCPNTTITTVMFNYLIEMTQKILVCGSYGSSKTAAIITYQKLSSYVFNYQFQFHLCDQFQELVKEKLVYNRFPKVLYISTRPNSINFMSVKRAILKQVQELQASEYQKIQNSQTLKEINELILENYLRAGIRIKPVFDDINHYVSLARIYNSRIIHKQQHSSYLLAQIQQLLVSKQTQTLHRNLQKISFKYQSLVDLQQSFKKQQNLFQETYKHPFQHFGHLLEQFLVFGSRHLYISSTNIECQCISYSKRQQKCIFFSIDGFARKQINFHKMMRTKEGKNDFLQYFWFQIKRNIFVGNKDFEQSLLVSIKEIFYHQCLSSNPNGFWRYSFIASYFQSTYRLRKQMDLGELIRMMKSYNKQLFAINILQGQKWKDQISSYFQLLLAGFSQYCAKRCSKNLQDFIKNPSTEQQVRIRLARILYRLSQQLIAKNIGVVFMRKQFIKDIGLRMSAIFQSNQNYARSTQLLFLQYFESDAKVLQFSLSPQEFIQVLKPILSKVQDDIALLNSKKNVRMMMQYPLFKERYIQLILANILVPQTSLIFKNNNSRIEFKLRRETYFRSFFEKSPPNTSNSIQDNLQQTLKESLYQKQKYIIGKHYYADLKNDKIIFKWTHEQNPEPLDFVIIKYQQAKQRFYINTFDLTASQQFQRRRLNHFGSLIKQIVKVKFSPKYEKYSFQINHTLICFRQFCQTDYQYQQQEKYQKEPPFISYIKQNNFFIINLFHFQLQSFQALQDLSIDTQQPSLLVQVLQFKHLHSYLLNQRNKND